ncbi:hypothetical protein PWT90_05760 [Aphanocladium album]|nr:hypothetical protein PWT90_05760 [Aphanocladium album]
MVVPRVEQSSPAGMTSPFQAPTGCSDQFPITTSVARFTDLGDGSAIDRIYPAEFSDSRSFPTCQPPGFDPSAARILDFEPGVCPSQWIAYSLQVESLAKNTFATEALCCSRNASGFSPQNISTTGQPIPEMLYCVQDSVSPDVLRIHQAWTIRWHSTDIPSLTRSPPDLSNGCGNVQIQTWIPDATTESVIGQATNCIAHSDRNQLTRRASGDEYGGIFFFIIIGIPIIGSCIVGFFVWWCCVRPVKKHNRRRRQREAELAHLDTFTPVPESGGICNYDGSGPARGADNPGQTGQTG